MDNSSQNIVDLTSGSAARSYRPSGRVNALLFVPIFLFALGIAFLMALLLYIVSGSWYLFFITPLLFCLPVLGGIYITIRGGRCRSGVLAAITGLAMMLAYYGGYWNLHYFAFMSYYEEKAQPILEYETGSKGFWGFMQYYCKNSTIESYPNPTSKDRQPGKADAIFSCILYSGELIILLALGMRMSYVLSQRIFDESTKRWAGAKKLRFLVSDLPELQRIIDQKDWAGLQKLTRLPKFGHQTTFLEFITEFSKTGDAALPVYVSVKSNHLVDHNDPKSKTKIAKSIFSKYLVKQIAMDGSQLQRIAEALPELKLPYSGQARPTQQAAAKGDFRDGAVAASLTQIGHWTSATISDMDASVCLSIPDEHHVSAKKMAMAKIGILVMGLVFIFGGLGIAVWGTQMTLPDSQDLTPLGKMIATSGAALFGLSILIIFGHLVIYTALLKHFLLGRPGSLFSQPNMPKLRMALVEDPKTYHRSKLATEDVCLYHIDKQKQRLVMEGCNHRYIIRGRDITRLESLKSGPEMVIGIYFKIGDTESSIVFQVESITWYALNPLLTMKSAGRFIKRLSTDLGVQI